MAHFYINVNIHVYTQPSSFFWYSYWDEEREKGCMKTHSKERKRDQLKEGLLPPALAQARRNQSTWSLSYSNTSLLRQREKR